MIMVMLRKYDDDDNGEVYLYFVRILVTFNKFGDGNGDV